MNNKGRYELFTEMRSILPMLREHGGQVSSDTVRQWAWMTKEELDDSDMESVAAALGLFIESGDCDNACRILFGVAADFSRPTEKRSIPSGAIKWLIALACSITASLAVGASIFYGSAPFLLGAVGIALMAGWVFSVPD